MIDMRSEEDSLSPHSQVRHELIHNQYNKLKEDEDYWQDVSAQIVVMLFNIVCVLQISILYSVCVSGSGPLEESPEERVSRFDKERRGEEDDGEDDEWRRMLTEKEKHQDVQRDSGGEVGLCLAPF